MFLSLSTLACSEDSDDARPDLDAGIGLHDAAVDPGAADAQVDSSVVVSGACAVSDSYRIEVPADFSSTFEISRLLGGFVLSAGQRCAVEGGDLLFSLLPGGVSRLQVPESNGIGLCSIPVADDRTHPALVVTTYSPGLPMGPLSATAWRGTPVAPSTTQTIGEAYYRGTAQHNGAPSFDGERVVITSGHVAVDPPDAIMVGLDGARVGEVVSLGIEAASPSFDCLAVTPTEHGAIVSVIDRNSSGDVLRLVELGADGAVVQRSAHPTAGCGLVVSSPTATVAALPRVDGSFRVVELLAGQVHELPAPTAPMGNPRWLAKAADGGLLWLESTAELTLRMLHVSPTGTTRVLAANLGAGRALQGESGRLFLIRDFTSGTQQIDEISCAL